MALILHSSNRLEHLAARLAALLRDDPLPPLESETVVTQSTGMSRWLTLTLAEHLGVAMNIRFPFPAAFAAEVFTALIPGKKSEATFQRDVLPWRVHAVLPGLLEMEEFTELRDFAGGDESRRWQLAQLLATTLDRYVAYRPQMLREWDRSRGDAPPPDVPAGPSSQARRWQHILWREVAADAPHPASLVAQLARTPPRKLPRRVSIFGISALAPLYLELLEALQPRLEIHFFHLSPTLHYWGDIQSEREQSRHRRWCEKRGVSAPTHVEVGHPLLASLGRAGREFHEALLDLSPEQEHDYFEEPRGDTALARLQRDVLNLEHGGSGAPTAPGPAIRIHNCHSPLRELEVLHDELLARFEADPSLVPRDVLVCVPDIATYAPFVEAVFGAPESDAVRFPWSVADRSLRTESGVADAFLRLLDTATGRFPASEMLALLDCPAIHECAGLAGGDIALVRQWMLESGIRWGRDAAHRASLGLPARGENTWQSGMDRLLLGFALGSTAGTNALFEGILPAGGVEGSLAATLGKFVNFSARFFDVAAAFARPRPLVEWATALHSTLAEFCAGDFAFAEPWERVAATIANLSQLARHAGHEADVPFEIIRDHLASALSDDGGGVGFLRGGITFCSLRPMRAVPHRVVCLLGMGDGFPRQEQAPSFDLTARQPRPGDRSVRDEDRYLFLDAILSARDALHLSWCGQSQKDNSALPPSVVVAELLALLGDSVAVTKHALQPFSPRYFSSGPLFSYSAENAAASVSAARRVEPPPFATTLPPVEVPREVTIERLADCLANPAKFFARERLNIRLPSDDAQPEDSEPVELGGLERFQLASELTEANFDGQVAEAQLPLATAAAGLLPHGYAGTSAFHQIARDVREMTRLASKHAPGRATAPLPIACETAGWRVSGSLRILTQTALLTIRAAKLKGRDLLRAWAGHVFLCAATPPGAPLRSVVVGSDGAREFRTLKPEAAAGIAAELLDFYAATHQGAQPFFAETSLGFAGKPSPVDGMKEAHRRWNGGFRNNPPAEKADDWIALIWRGVEAPLGTEFQTLARKIYGPMLAAMSELE